MTPDWICIGEYENRTAAEIVAGLLGSESIPVRIAAREPIPGLAENFSVEVEADHVYRARWLIHTTRFSEEELAELASTMKSADE